MPVLTILVQSADLCRACWGCLSTLCAEKLRNPLKTCSGISCSMSLLNYFNCRYLEWLSFSFPYSPLFFIFIVVGDRTQSLVYAKHSTTELYDQIPFFVVVVFCFGFGRRFSLEVALQDSRRVVSAVFPPMYFMFSSPGQALVTVFVFLILPFFFLVCFLERVSLIPGWPGTDCSQG